MEAAVVLDDAAVESGETGWSNTIALWRRDGEEDREAVGEVLAVDAREVRLLDPRLLL